MKKKLILSVLIVILTLLAILLFYKSSYVGHVPKDEKKQDLVVAMDQTTNLLETPETSPHSLPSNSKKNGADSNFPAISDSLLDYMFESHPLYKHTILISQKQLDQAISQMQVAPEHLFVAFYLSRDKVKREYYLNRMQKEFPNDSLTVEAMLSNEVKTFSTEVLNELIVKHPSNLSLTAMNIDAMQKSKKKSEVLALYRELKEKAFPKIGDSIVLGVKDIYEHAALPESSASIVGGLVFSERALKRVSGLIARTYSTLDQPENPIAFYQNQEKVELIRYVAEALEKDNQLVEEKIQSQHMRAHAIALERGDSTPTGILIIRENSCLKSFVAIFEEAKSHLSYDEMGKFLIDSAHESEIRAILRQRPELLETLSPDCRNFIQNK
jgi:hypothetical protein